MTIQLPDDLERYVQAKVESGRFASEQDAITEAVHFSDWRKNGRIPRSKLMHPRQHLLGDEF